MSTLTGVSMNPFDQPNVGELIRFTCVEATGSVHVGIQATIQTEQNGAYSTSLSDGKYLVEVQQKGSNEWVSQGYVHVDNTVPLNITLPELLINHGYAPV